MSSTSTYTPIPTTTTTTSTTQPRPPPPPPLLSTNLDYISRAKTRLYSTLSTRRPWRQLLDYHSLFPFPHSFSDSFSRLKTNLIYFRLNFILFILVVLFLSLLWHPVSLIVFIILFVGWLYLYFLRDEPLVVYGREIAEWIVVTTLGVLTIGFLVLTGVTVNVVAAVGSSVVVVVVYSALRRTDDLYLDEEEAESGGLVARGGRGMVARGGLGRVGESSSSSY